MTDRVAVQLKEFLSETVPYPALNPVFVPVEVTPGVVHIRAGPHAGPAATFHSEAEDSHLLYAIERADGATPLDTILREFSGQKRKEVLGVYKSLYEKRILENGNGSESHRGRKYTTISPYSGSENGPCISDSTVGIVGTTGLSTVLTLLVQAGVSEFIVYSPVTDYRPDSTMDIDADVIHENSIGAVVTRSDACLSLTHGTGMRLPEQVNRVAHETETPWITGHVSGFDGFIGPMVFPTETPCYQCFTTRLTANVENARGYQNIRTTPQSASDSHSITHHAMQSALVQIIAGYTCLDFLYLLQFGQGFTAGRSIHINGFSLGQRVNDILRDPRCNVCQSSWKQDRSSISDWRTNFLTETDTNRTGKNQHSESTQQ